MLFISCDPTNFFEPLPKIYKENTIFLFLIYKGNVADNIASGAIFPNDIQGTSKSRFAIEML